MSYEKLHALTDKKLGIKKGSKSSKINGELWHLTFDYLDFHYNNSRFTNPSNNGDKE